MISKVGGTVAKICPKCGEELNQRGFCANCKISFEVYEKIKLSSKQLYNQGLHLAKVRDLSGAINVLQRSVRFDKTNIDARNLLGLVYFEIGETVLAIQQWVISKNQKPSDNIAGKYLKIIQENQTHLDKLSSAIKKYNQALQHIKQDSEDLAVIQLKKVLSLNPKFIKAYALLALCMIKENQIPKAQKILLKILTIDKNNYIARKYYDAISEEEPISKVVQTEEESDSRQEAAQPHRRAPVLFGSSF
ncbi:MAG: tetratricopeptide repeat protein, partial [Vallitaleaceae bacterium]|nr:tetratricopeptide repeat protein [Vallitaleaceae bacterium]